MANIGWLSLDKLFQFLIALVLGALIARYFGPAGFGKLNIAMAFVAIARAPISLGLDSIITRDIVMDPPNHENLIRVAMALRLLAGILFYPLTLALAYFLYSDSETYLLICVLGLPLIFQALAVTTSWFQANLLAKNIVLAQNASFLAVSLLRVWLLWAKRPLIEFAAATALEPLIWGVINFFNYKRKSGAKLRLFPFNTVLAKSLLAQSWPLVLTGISVVIYMKIDQLMLGSMVGEAAAGEYSAALKLSEIWYIIPSILASSLFPSIVKSKAGGERFYHRRLKMYYELNAGLGIGLALITTFIAGPVVHLVYGQAYSGAASILTIHIWACALTFLGIAKEQFLITEGYFKFSFICTMAGAVINILLNLWWIPLFGGNGAASATVCSQFTAVILGMVIYRKTRSNGMMLLSSLLIPFKLPTIIRALRSA